MLLQAWYQVPPLDPKNKHLLGRFGRAMTEGPIEVRCFCIKKNMRGKRGNPQLARQISLPTQLEYKKVQRLQDLLFKNHLM